MARTWGFNDLPMMGERARKARPRILFAAEIMNSAHVQYRYFGQYLRQLRSRFELVLLTQDKEVDDPVRALFDTVLTFDRDAPRYLGSIYRMIVDAAPDILFYPSVGMRHWGPLFANLRLAPIQLTALGHSASTFCDTIDYYLLEAGYVSDPALFGETVLTVPDESLIFERMPDFSPPPPRIRATPNPLRIVLPSNLLKLNPGFLAVLARVRAAVKRPLEFHFLANARALEHASLNRMVQQILPGARVHGTLSYARYIETISACDLNLSPFPFGGLHSVIDSLRQGLPVVAMDCPEPHGRTDAMLLRRLGMPEWLIAKNEDAYVAAALRLIEDDALRVSLSEQALAIDVGDVMFGDATTPLRSEIVDTLWWLYHNHEQVQADGRKLWSQADRAAFPG
jgi:predicted O-linked N-acetylglucosamine transferase (SPINDLY family)